MYNSQYYTCEQIDERLLQGYLDDYNTQTGQSLTKAQFLTKLGSIFSKEGVIDNTATQIGYYECDTAAGTAAKAITVANYALFAGGSMKVKFANKNTANNATLNINRQGAKALYYQGERASATNSWDANEVVEIYYDGISYYANNVKGGSGSGVYDVSKEHPTSGPNSDGKFTLEYIINSSNVNELIPVNKRYPGMTIQFVSTSDNKYVQYRLMSDTFNTTPANWQGVDDEPIAGSDNLVKSGGVFAIFNTVNAISLNWIEGHYLNRLGHKQENSNSSYTEKTEIPSDASNLIINLEETSTSGRYTVLYAGDTVLQAWSENDISVAGGIVNVDLSVYRLQYPNSTFYVALSKVTTDHLTASTLYNKFDKLSQECIKVIEQSLTEDQKEQARSNIDAIDEEKASEIVESMITETTEIPLTWTEGYYYNRVGILQQREDSSYSPKTLIDSAANSVKITLQEPSERGMCTLLYADETILRHWEEYDITAAGGEVVIDLSEYKTEYPNASFYIAASKTTTDHLNVYYKSNSDYDVIRYTEQQFTESQKEQARENIGAVSEFDVQNDINNAIIQTVSLDLVFINGAFYDGNYRLVENSSSKYTENTLIPSEYHTLHIEVTPTNESARRTYITHGLSPESALPIIAYTEESLSEGGIDVNVDNLRNQYQGDNIYIAVSILNSSTFSTNNVTIDKYVTQEQLNVVNEKVDALKNSDIECWGDSLTAAGLYEAAMVEEIPNTFTVLNCGVSGENIYDICARAGAMPIFTKNAITLVPNTEVQIGDINDSGLYTYDTLGNIVALKPRRQAVSDDKFNPLYINGIECQLYWRAGGPTDPNGLYKLSGVGITGNVTIPANTICYPFGVKNLKKPHCSILWMGTNGGYDITSTQGIYDTMVKAINQFKEANNPEVLLVVGLHLADTTYRANLEKIMATEYGPFYFNLRKYLVEFGCADAGVTPTSADEAAMAAGNCPPSLLKDGTHFTNAAYAAIGRKIAQILSELGIVELT